MRKLLLFILACAAYAQAQAQVVTCRPDGYGGIRCETRPTCMPGTSCNG